MSRFRMCSSVFSMLLLAVWTAYLPMALGDDASPKRLLLLGQGPDGHPATTHEYVAGLRILQKCLERAHGVDAVLVRADEPWREGPEAIDKADGAVLYLSEGARWIHQDEARLAALQRLAKRGGGLAALHWGMGTKDAKNIENYVQLLGGCHGGPDRKYKVLTVETEIADAKHPVMTGVAPVKVEEEFYYKLKFHQSKEGADGRNQTPRPIVPLLKVPIDGESHTVAWAWERGPGRSFGFSGGHFHKNWEQAAYRRMAVQGILWTLGLPIPESGVNVDVAEEVLKLK